MTQEELAEAAAVTQAALSRYEHGLRTPDPDVLQRLARSLGVTPALLERGDRMRGGIAVAAHMRRRATAKVSVWRTLEARLNMLRLHTMQLHEEITMRAELQAPTFDPAEDDPEDAARMLRVQWRLPVGPVHSLASWMEGAGILIFEEDIGSAARVDGLSQWAEDHALVLLNASAPADRRRLTLAHELGHLLLHWQYADDEMEDQANRFGAEILMPAAEIGPMLRGRLTLSRLVDLKRYWGTSMQSLIERAFHLGAISAPERTSLYKQLSARRWRTNEPASDEVPVETPRLANHIADALQSKGLTMTEVAHLTGFWSPKDNNVFVPSRGRRHLMPA
jgi:Zn-dependent peptidase ImmA (M78 family)